MVIMEKEGIFNQVGIQYFSDICLHSRPTKITEGVTERHSNKNPGLVCIYDGKSVVDHCLEDGADIIVKGDKGIVETQNVGSLEGLLDFMAQEPDDDVVYVVNTSENIGHKVKGGLRNMAKGVKVYDLESQLPDDFASRDGSVSKHHVGNRTDAAMLAAYLLNAQNYSDGSEARVMILKETAYGGTKFGKLAEFGPGGFLYKEFSVVKSKKSDQNYFDPNRRLVGIYREYQPVDGKARLVSESYVHINPEGIVEFTPKTESNVYTIQPPQPLTPKIAAVGNFS